MVSIANTGCCLLLSRKFHFLLLLETRRAGVKKSYQGATIEIGTWCSWVRKNSLSVYGSKVVMSQPFSRSAVTGVSSAR